MRLSDLPEGRDAPLFHGTPLDLFFGIMFSDSLVGGEPDDAIGHERASVRLSRNYRTALGFSAMGADKYGAVIEIDQRLLVQNYKVVPFHDQEYAGERSNGQGESEEVVLHDQIRPLSKVMTRFYANVDDIMAMLKPESIRRYGVSSFSEWDAEELTRVAQFLANHPKRVDIK